MIRQIVFYRNGVANLKIPVPTWRDKKRHKLLHFMWFIDETVLKDDYMTEE